MQATFPFYPFHGRTYIHAPSPTPPPLSPGCHSNSVGGEHHHCLTPLCNHTPNLFLLPLQSHVSVPIIQQPYPLHLQVAPSSRPIGLAGFYVTAGGVKLLSNNEGRKKRDRSKNGDLVFFPFFFHFYSTPPPLNSLSSVHRKSLFRKHQRASQILFRPSRLEHRERYDLKGF